MSLDFNVSRCKDYKTLTTHPTDKNRWHPVTDAIIWNMMAIDMNSITEANLDECWFRTQCLSLLYDQEAVAYEKDGEYVKVYLTREDLERHIGLSTNVSTKTRAQWVKRFFTDSKGDRWINNRRGQEGCAIDLVNTRCAEFAAEEAAKKTG